MADCRYCGHALSETEPRFCPSCGQDLAIPPDLPLSPPPAVSASGTPWERRREIGLGAALVETTQQVLTSPEAFFRSMPTSGGILDPLLYGLIVGYVGLVAATLYGAVFSATFNSAFMGFGHRPELQRILPLMQGGVSVVVNLIFGPIFIAVGLFISSGILHLLLMLLGGGARGFEATFRVVAYASAARLIQILPLCGGMIGFVYLLVLWIIGLSAAHGDSKGKAATAVLIPPFLCCCCCLTGLITIGALVGFSAPAIMDKVRELLGSAALAGGVASLAGWVR